MRGVLILISVLAATIPVGFFKPGPLDDITINLNLDESPKEEEEDTDTQVDQGEKISAKERVCGITQLGNCGLKFAGAVAKCVVNPGAIIECVKDIIADDSCIDCIFALIQLAGGNIKCSDTVSGPEEEEDTDARVAQVWEKITKESKGLMALGKSRQISAQERSCGLTQLKNCALKFTGAVARCIVNPGAIIECVKDVITDDSCIDCIIELIKLAGGDIKCSGMLPLPPPYISIPGIKKCLGTKFMGSGSVWCLPFEKPTACNPSSWEQVMMKDPKKQLPPCGKIWAVLVAGSYGWLNYRHQADVCHAYQVLHDHGVDDENIVVIMKDDIAYNTKNPTQGKIIHRPDGPNVYEGVPKDYTGNSVTAQVFQSVLRGDKAGVSGKGSGKVVESGPYDHIFVFYADHGTIGVLPFGDEILTTQELNTIIFLMNYEKKFGKFLFYVEACHSGSLFKGILPGNIGVLAVTASSPSEDSFPCFWDPKRKTYLGDVFSVAWMEDSSRRNLWEWTVDQQITTIRKEVTSSSVMEYGDASIGNLTVAQFQGMNGKIGPDAYHANINDAVACGEVALKTIQLIAGEKMDEEINQLMNKRRFVDYVVENLVLKVLGNTNAENEILLGKNEISNFDCHSKAVKKFHESCFNLGKNSYALTKIQVLVNLCEAQHEEDIENAMDEVCTHSPVVGTN